VLLSLWPEAVAEAEEVLLVDLLEDQHQRFLDDLVFQGGDADRALIAVGLGYPFPFVVMTT
jgi:hypothetical protein